MAGVETGKEVMDTTNRYQTTLHNYLIYFMQALSSQAAHAETNYTGHFKKTQEKALAVFFVARIFCTTLSNFNFPLFLSVQWWTRYADSWAQVDTNSELWWNLLSESKFKKWKLPIQSNNDKPFLKDRRRESYMSRVMYRELWHPQK